MGQQPDCLRLDAFGPMLVEGEGEERHTKVVSANCHTAGVSAISCGPANTEMDSDLALHLQTYALQT